MISSTESHYGLDALVMLSLCSSETHVWESLAELFGCARQIAYEGFFSNYECSSTAFLLWASSCDSTF